LTLTLNPVHRTSSNATARPRHWSSARLAALTFSALAAFLVSGSSQTVATPGEFVPGSREIIKLDLASTPVGGFPASLRSLGNGKITVGRVSVAAELRDNVHRVIVPRARNTG